MTDNNEIIHTSICDSDRSTLRTNKSKRTSYTLFQRYQETKIFGASENGQCFNENSYIMEY
jgi:hypothetical protein